MLHGTPSSSLIWRNVVPRLVASGYRAHVYDLLGYGASERPSDPAIDTSISGQVPFLEALLDHWDLDAVNLVAHDIGGGIAQRFCIFRPDLVRSLALVDSVSFDSYPSERTRRQLASGLDSLTSAKEADHRARFRDWLLTAVHDKQSFADGALESYIDMISGPVGQASYFQHQARHYDPIHTTEIADRLHELGCMPVKVIWGAEDAWQTTDWACKLQSSIPGAELILIQAAGHFLPEDKPSELADVLTSFLRFA
ncbi:alpha/beta fold hydrolase [Salipiger mucosus]|uniref:alpha/beta fold hydrolase n=1 Tax=Salipiger mucosus TaxID=263378 RepID=UPI001C3043E1|nr:alpha/beta hydrolase [Salipiger mucosus]